MGPRNESRIHHAGQIVSFSLMQDVTAVLPIRIRIYKGLPDPDPGGKKA